MTCSALQTVIVQELHSTAYVEIGTRREKIRGTMTPYDAN